MVDAAAEFALCSAAEGRSAPVLENQHRTALVRHAAQVVPMSAVLVEKPMKRLLPVLAGTLLLAGCVTTATPVASAPVPPPLPAETRPLPPLSNAPLTWQPGDWVYTGGSYRYQPGQYVPAAGHSRDWAFGHWAMGPQGGYVWIPGGWAG